MSKKAAAKSTPKKAAKPAKVSSKSLLVENRVFKPGAEFAKKARISSMAQYKAMHAESLKQPGQVLRS
jgi:acetyl-CoA synthetase